MPQNLKTQFGITIRWYLSYCRKEELKVSFASAKLFFSHVDHERTPQDWQMEQWRNALRWFFRSSKKAGAFLETSQENGGSCPGAAVANQDWERTLVTAIRRRHFQLKTEKGNVQAARQFARFAGSDPAKWDEEVLKRYLDFRAVKENVSAGTQKKDLNALVFLLRDASGVDSRQMDRRGQAAHFDIFSKTCGILIASRLADPKRPQRVKGR